MAHCFGCNRPLRHEPSRLCGLCHQRWKDSMDKKTYEAISEIRDLLLEVLKK